MKTLTPSSTARGSRRGLALMELTINLAITAILMLGMASAVKISLLAVPTAAGRVTTTLDTSEALELVVAELRYATAVTSIGATQVTFTVPDRDGLAPATETITYSWSGTPGAPLLRSFNGTAATVLPNVYDFALTPTTRVVQLPLTYSESTESLLVSYSSNSSLAGFDETSLSWAGQYVIPSLPLADSWKITQIKFNAKSNGTKDGTTLVQIRSASGGLPDDDLLDQAVLSESTLSENYEQQTFIFDSVPYAPISTGLCLVLQFDSNSPACSVQYRSSGANPGNCRFLSTTNSGWSWSSSSSRSLLFEVWGKYKTQDAQQSQTFLADVRCALRSGTNVSSRLERTVKFLNEPLSP